MPIKIASTQEGFRRCGIAHSREPQVYPDGRFTQEEIEILKNESMLMVEIIKPKVEIMKPKSPGGKQESKESLMELTVAELKKIGEKYDCKETAKEKLVDEILAAQKKGN